MKIDGRPFIRADCPKDVSKRDKRSGKNGGEREHGICMSVLAAAVCMVVVWVEEGKKRRKKRRKRREEEALQRCWARVYY